MAPTWNYGYLRTATGILNLIEMITLIAALISLAFTSRLFCELVDNLRSIYSDLSTSTVRSLFQTFAVLCFIITGIIFLVHLFSFRYSRRNFPIINQISLIANVLMGLMMISIGICAAFWEDKLQRTPGIIRRGYLSNQYQTVFNERTHPGPGAAAAAAAFGILTGILFLLEACTRPMLGAAMKNHLSASNINTAQPIYTLTSTNTRIGINDRSGDRLIPIQSTGQQHERI